MCVCVCVQVAALHCVMLPERMEGKFRPPYLPVLASRFLDPCQAVSCSGYTLLEITPSLPPSLPPDQRGCSGAAASRVEEDWGEWEETAGEGLGE